MTIGNKGPENVNGERQEVVVEGSERPVVFDRVPELFTVWVSQGSVLAGGVHRPSAPTEAVGDGDPDTLVAVQRTRHAEAESVAEDRKSSMWS